MVILVLFLCLALALILIKSSSSKYKQLKSPGICFPIVGHAYKLFTKSAINNTAEAMWEIYKKYNNGGILYFNTFSMNSVWIGDLKTLKYLLNHPSTTPRLNQKMSLLSLPPRKISGKVMTGVLMSDGDIWHQQRRFTLRTLRDFGFGKQGIF